jgi:hypothetical protein
VSARQGTSPGRNAAFWTLAGTLAIGLHGGVLTAVLRMLPPPQAPAVETQIVVEMIEVSSSQSVDTAAIETAKTTAAVKPDTAEQETLGTASSAENATSAQAETLEQANAESVGKAEAQAALTAEADRLAGSDRTPEDTLRAGPAQATALKTAEAQAVDSIDTQTARKADADRVESAQPEPEPTSQADADTAAIASPASSERITGQSVSATRPVTEATPAAQPPANVATATSNVTSNATSTVTSTITTSATVTSATTTGTTTATTAAPLLQRSSVQAAQTVTSPPTQSTISVASAPTQTAPQVGISSPVMANAVAVAPAVGTAPLRTNNPAPITVTTAPLAGATNVPLPTASAAPTRAVTAAPSAVQIRTAESTSAPSAAVTVAQPNAAALDTVADSVSPRVAVTSAVTATQQPTPGPTTQTPANRLPNTSQPTALAGAAPRTTARTAPSVRQTVRTLPEQTAPAQRQTRNTLAPAVAPSTSPRVAATASASLGASQDQLAMISPEPKAIAPQRLVPRESAPSTTLAPLAAPASEDDPAPSAPSAGALDTIAPGPEGSVGATERARYTAVLEFLKSYDGGPCFAALPALGELSGSLSLDAFGETDQRLDGFRQGIEAKAGVVPSTFLKPVSDAQCATLAFIKATPRYPEFGMYFRVAEREIISGNFLSGEILNTTGMQIHLLLIDDDGLVQSLDSFLKFTRSAAVFEIPMTFQGGPIVTQQLLMAVGSIGRLDTIKAMNGTPAQDFFTALQDEQSARALDIDMSMIAFSVK